MDFKKIKTKKLFGKEVVFSIIVIFQILLLINMSVADSYNIYKTARLIETPKAIENNENNEIKNLINLGINLLIGIFSIKQIGIVSAEESAVFWCCPETNGGAICQDTLSTNSESCSVPLIETSCDYASGCEKGCCFTDEGICQTNSPEGKCTNDGGEWFEDKGCDVTECQEGCCVLGSNTEWTTETNCENLSSEGGFDKEFRNDIKTETECLWLSATQEEGACVLNERCSIKTEAECLSNGGSFEGGFCSDADPENYIAHNYTGCLNEQMKSTHC